MKRNSFRAAGRFFAAAAVMLFAALVLAQSASAVTEKVLCSLTGPAGPDGNGPHSGLIFDDVGNLYGTTWSGGLYGHGSFYKCGPNPDGTWSETILHSFNGSDGDQSDWGRLTFDSAGNLYGVTAGGGKHGVGVLFKFTPNPDGTWTETILHHFTGGKDGSWPRTTIYIDAQGTLYGAASYGGSKGCGTLYKMAPGSNRVIHQFMDSPACSPWVGLIPDAGGNLYGTTRNTVNGCSKPPNECGTVFKMTPSPDGKWSFQVIHRFKGGNDGSDPSVSGLIFDDAGNLYGTTEHGGAHGSGVFFTLMPGPNGKWTYQVLHDFDWTSDGAAAIGSLVRDPAGNIYGSAANGGEYGFGTVYEMTPNPDGTWTFSVVYAFTGSDGIYPLGNLNIDAAGNLYGVTGAGGAYGAGTVFEITP